MTVNRLSMLSPRIRYNIHDVGGTVGFDRMLTIGRDFGLDLEAGPMDGADAVALPCSVLGRIRLTLSYMGANIYPEDVEQALFSDAPASDADRVGGFCLQIVDLVDGRSWPCVHVEVDDPSDAGSPVGSRSASATV